MSEPVTTALAPRAPRELREVQSTIPLFDTGDFEHMQRVAKALAMASVIPDHLRAKPYFMPKNGLPPAELKAVRAELGEAEWARAWAEADARTTANCFLVVNQARNWSMDPVAVAMASYVVGGKIAYEGKLVAALVNTRAKLAQKLWYTFAGEGLDLEITVHGTREGETVDRTVSVSVQHAKTDNQMWTKDPEQKLVYTGSIKWARRWVPEVVLGVTTDDDLEVIEKEKNITPGASGGVRGLEEKLAAKVEQQPAENVAPAAAARPADPPPVVAAGSALEASSALPPPVTLPPEDIEQLRGRASAYGVSWEAVEEYFGGPLAEFSEAGKDVDALGAMVLDAIRSLAKEAKAAGSGAPPAEGSLFDDKSGKGKK